MSAFLSRLLGGDTPGGRENGDSISWNPLEQEEQLNTLEAESYHRPQLIFKHSTRCGLSGMTLRRFERQWAPARDQAGFHLLDVIGQRGLSQAIAERYALRHESPQLLIIESGKLREAASHSGLLGLSLSENP
ncbi:bacillithiol system redox-active protein YtxJ [Robiginitalea sp. M366]|uniref:bacillithiol system redox-active protein YtxJ n=1 Tax=Robiginitalea aestuariiviva TaxID=3036903 RepID=UPI00240D5DC4|nr:bacillithiol system redox-active protein YtxJ [Robiginitalea aestuariiviva]MDG1573111.1 bacillithiol system redox-active protein YtxJ [Robiginitalea aestuariiviva]